MCEQQAEVIPRSADDVAFDIRYLSLTVPNLDKVLAAVEGMVFDMSRYADVSDVQEGLFIARSYASRLRLRDPNELAREYADDWASSEH